MITLKSKINVQVVAKGKRQFLQMNGEVASSNIPIQRKLPRITRLMALAIHFDEMLRTGVVSDMIELAHRAKVSQPRMTQILALNLLAPEIQKALLELPPQSKGKSNIHEKRLRSLTSINDWEIQRSLWTTLKGSASNA
jgi:hypothetical protein